MIFDGSVTPTVIKINPLDAVTSVGSHTVQEFITLENYSVTTVVINWTIIV